MIARCVLGRDGGCAPDAIPGPALSSVERKPDGFSDCADRPAELKFSDIEAVVKKAQVIFPVPDGHFHPAIAPPTGVSGERRDGLGHVSETLCGLRMPPFSH